MVCIFSADRDLVVLSFQRTVVRYSKDYILGALEAARKTYAKTLETGFDMYY